MHHARCLRWYGGQGQALYAGVDVVLTHRPHVPGVRDFVEIGYEPAAHSAWLRLPRRRTQVEMSREERAACDQALDRMARAARAALEAA